MKTTNSCPECSKPLNRSYRDGARKSCPRCFVLAGVHVFKPLEDFGERNDRGETIIQSWCNACRSAK